MTATALKGDLESLRARVRQLEETAVRQPLPTLPALTGLVELRPGAAYEVDSASLVLALLAGASRQGLWSSVVGLGDLGWEAATALGVDLGRTVVVPDPREHWLEVTAALIELAGVVALRPPGRAAARDAHRIAARLRSKGTALIVWGSWPMPEGRLSLSTPRWSGLGRGEGRLHTRSAVLTVRKGAGPERHAELLLSGDGTISRVVSDTRAPVGPVDEQVAV
ncbi:MAG: hypothetical protein QM655_08000 [Nocardioidaceae bacterium]